MANAIQIPTSVAQWKVTAKKNGVLGSIEQLGSQVKVRSASKFTFNHFLGLRVIYQFQSGKTKKSLLPADIVTQFSVPPQLALENSDFWNEYLQQIRDFANNRKSNLFSLVPEELGPLVNAWQYQKHVILGDGEYADISKISAVSPIERPTRNPKQFQAQVAESPTSASRSRPMQEELEAMNLNEIEDSSEDDEDKADLHEDLYGEASDDSFGEEGDADPAADDDPKDTTFISPGVDARGHLIKDEQTVNVFLLAFLSAITATTVPFHTRWQAERNSMEYKKKVRYVARTDGHLCGRTGRSHSLIEVKPKPRIDEDGSIRIQESAQMAVWLTQHKVESHDPHKDCRIFLLSLDKDEIFLTFPRWGKAYGKDPGRILRINNLGESAFLWMEEYGPFSLSSADDVAEVANFLHAYTLHVSEMPNPSGL